MVIALPRSPEGTVAPRCTSCNAVLADAPGGPLAELCVACRRRKALEGARKLGSSKEERAKLAMQYAAAHGVDLATAYLALLGVQPAAKTEPAPTSSESASVVEAEPANAPVAVAEPEASVEPAPAPDPEIHFVIDVEHVAEPEESVEPPPASQQDADSSDPLVQKTYYDPDFREAVDGGFITPRQALERGNRAAYAAKLALRYGLQMDVAFLLADNRIMLDDAIDVEEASVSWRYDALAEKDKPEPGWRFKVRPTAAVAMVVLGAISGLAVYEYGPWSEPPRPKVPMAAEPSAVERRAAQSAPHDRSLDGESLDSPAVPRVEFLADDSGSLTQVSGPDPQSVLDSFCAYPRNRTKFTCESIAYATVPSPSERIGVLMDRERAKRVGVVISRNERTRRWQIGSGQGAITVLDSVPSR